MKKIFIVFALLCVGAFSCLEVQAGNAYRWVYYLYGNTTPQDYSGRRYNEIIGAGTANGLIDYTVNLSLVGPTYTYTWGGIIYPFTGVTSTDAQGNVTGIANVTSYYTLSKETSYYIGDALFTGKTYYDNTSKKYYGNVGGTNILQLYNYPEVEYYYNGTFAKDNTTSDVKYVYSGDIYIDGYGNKKGYIGDDVATLSHTTDCYLYSDENYKDKVYIDEDIPVFVWNNNSYGFINTTSVELRPDGNSKWVYYDNGQETTFLVKNPSGLIVPKGEKTYGWAFYNELTLETNEVWKDENGSELWKGNYSNNTPIALSDGKYQFISNWGSSTTGTIETITQYKDQYGSLYTGSLSDIYQKDDANGVTHYYVIADNVSPIELTSVPSGVLVYTDPNDGIEKVYTETTHEYTRSSDNQLMGWIGGTQVSLGHYTNKDIYYTDDKFVYTGYQTSDHKYGKSSDKYVTYYATNASQKYYYKDTEDNSSVERQIVWEGTGHIYDDNTVYLDGTDTELTPVEKHYLNGEEYTGTIVTQGGIEKAEVNESKTVTLTSMYAYTYTQPITGETVTIYDSNSGLTTYDLHDLDVALTRIAGETIDDPVDVNGHVTIASTFNKNDVAIINLNACSESCEHTTLASILDAAKISEKTYFDKVEITGNSSRLSNFTSGFGSINARAINLDKVSGLGTSPAFTNNYVKYLILPYGLTKEQVNNSVANVGTNFESAASANKDIDGWKYIDPESQVSTVYPYSHIVSKNGKTYGLPITNKSVQKVFVDNCYKDAEGEYYYSDDNNLYLDGNTAYLINSGATKIELTPSNNYVKADGTSYTNQVLRYEGSKTYGYEGTTYLLSQRSDVKYTYTHDGVVSVYDNWSSNLYSSDGKLYSLKNGGMLTEVQPQDDGTYLLNGKECWKTVYKDEINSKYYIESTSGQFYEVEDKQGQTVYLYNNSIYSGEVYYQYGNINNPYGVSGGTEIQVFNSYANNDVTYNGPIFIDKSDQYHYIYYGINDWENNTTALTTCYRYKYTDLKGEDHYNIYDNEQTSLSVDLSGDELYVELQKLTSADMKYQVNIIAYVKEPGTLAQPLKYMNQLRSIYDSTCGDNNWLDPGYKGHYGYMVIEDGDGRTTYKDLVAEMTISGNIFARDYATLSSHINTEGHTVTSCECINHDAIAKYGYELPSASDANIHYGTGDTGKDVACPWCRYTSLDLEDASFIDPNTGYYYPGDMTIAYNVNTSKLTSLKLPKAANHYVIPDHCLDERAPFEGNALKEICIPCNYTELHTLAFACNANGYKHVTTTAASDNDQKGVMQGRVIDNGIQSITIASTVNYIGYGAFDYTDARIIQDVYCIAKTAPVCEFGAFDKSTYIGENSHDGSHTVKRGNYITPAHGMAMLHYPTITTLAQQYNYTDVNRQYDRYDENGDTDNSGNGYIWPTQEQYNRAFGQAWAGVTWNAWIDYDPNRTDANIAWSGTGYGSSSHQSAFQDSYSGMSTTWKEDESTNVITSSNYEWNTNWAAASTPEASSTVEPLTYDWRYYGGWHEFVLCEAFNYEETDPNVNPTEKPIYLNLDKYQRNDWYSFCVPYNMTRKQLLEAFGDPTNNTYPNVKTLAYVIRNTNTKKITFMLSKNLMNWKLWYRDNGVVDMVYDSEAGIYKTQYTERGDADDEIIIEANKPYYLKPHLPQSEIDKAKAAGTVNANTQMLNPSRRIKVEKLTYNSGEVAFPDISCQTYALNADCSKYISGDDEEIDESDTTQAYRYHFVGTYVQQTMPQYAYFLSVSTRTGLSSLFHNTMTNRPWGKNTAIIVANRKYEQYKEGDKTYYNPTKKASADKGSSLGNYFVDASPVNDYIFTVNGVSQSKLGSFSMSFSLEDEQIDGTATTIIIPNEDGSCNEISSSAPVFNINGQRVGIYSDDLPKGVYVVEGKKFVVK